MEYIHHQMRVEIPLEGIVAIDELQLHQQAGDHGCLRIRARIEEEQACGLAE